MDGIVRAKTRAIVEQLAAGKIDASEARRLFGELQQELIKDHVEERLQELVATELGVPTEKVSRHRSLHLLGLSSAGALRLIHSLSALLDATLPATSLFEHPTLVELARYLLDQHASGVAKLTSRAGPEGPAPSLGQEDLARGAAPVAAARATRHPLAEGQKGLWALQMTAPGSSSYNLPLCLRVKGSLDVERLRRALRHVIARHPSLGAVIEEKDGELSQVLKGPESFALTVEDVARLDTGELPAWLRSQARLPFSLEQGPLLRVQVFSRSADEAFLLIVLHHIVFDGKSLVPFVSDLLAAYRGPTQPAEATRAAPYLDFVTREQAFLEGKEATRRRRYWEERARAPWPVSRLPPDHLRPPEGPRRPASRSMSISGDLRRKIKEFARSQQVYLSNLFLSVYQILLSRLTGEPDVVVGVALDQRPDKSFAGSVGCFVTMVPVRSRCAAEQSFAQFLASNQRGMLDALSHALPLPVLHRALKLPQGDDTSPVFQCAFAYQDILIGFDLERLAGPCGLRVEMVEEIHQEGEFELTCEVHETAEAFLVRIKYDADQYYPATIERLAQRFVALLAHVIDHPEGRLGRAPLLLEEEREATLRRWNQRPRDFPAQQTIHQVLAERVAERPEAIAVVCGDRTLRYRELWQKVNVVARYLRARGVGRETLVAIGMERSLDMVVGVLGILQAGAAYVPLSPDYPSERLAFMQQDCGAKILLSLGEVAAMFRRILDPAVEIVDLRRDWARMEETAVRHGEAPSQDSVSGADLAYVIYTSGSTGKPKGAMIEHRHVVNLLRFLQEEYPVGVEDSYLLKSNFAFDISVTELCGWFFGNGRLVILPPGAEMMPDVLVDTIHRERVTHVNFVPSVFGFFLDEAKQRPDFLSACSLRYILVGGEAFPKELVKDAVASFPRARVENLYGPTEAAICSTFFATSSTPILSPNTPIGGPIANATLYVLDEELEPMPIGRAGELYIGGQGVGRGYLNQPKISAERFLDNPFQPGTRMYKTGDLVRWLPDGQIEYLGRIDQQVKIRGYRIELGEIACELRDDSRVDDCVVIDQGEATHKQLVAFVVTSGNDRIDPAALRERLRRRLPDYMIPGRFVQVSRIPLTPNGKVDRAALKHLTVGADAAATTPEPAEPAPRGPARAVEAPPSSRATLDEAAVLGVWRELLKDEGIGLDDPFFEVGGNSLLAILLASRLRKALGASVGPADILKHPTVRSLCSALRAPSKPSRPEDTGPFDVSRPDRGQRPYPAYYEKSLAVIGVACRVPGAASPQEFWRLLQEGRDAIRFYAPEELAREGVPETVWRDPDFVPLRIELEDKDLFDPEFFGFSHRDAGLMDPQFRQLLMHAWQAIEDAGYTPEAIPDTSVFISASNSMYQALLPGGSLPMEKVLVDAEKYLSWMFAQGGSIPSMISYKLGLKGQSLFVHSNCSSSLTALSVAFQSIMTGQSSVALVGAATLLPVSQKGYLYQNGMNFSKKGRCSAFDAAADGMVGGEGVAVILVKRASDAVRDRDDIYGLIRGLCVNNDGADKAGFYAPSLKGQADVIEKALASAGVSPESIGYVEAHGTGTRLGDPLEFAALCEAFRKHTDRRQFCGIGSVKTNIGHLDTAAGLAGCIKVLLSLRHKAIPASLHYTSPNPEIDLAGSPFFVVDRLRPWDAGETPRRAALSSFGIGGTNVHAVLEEAPAADEAAALPPSLVPLSAKTPEGLNAYVERLLDLLRSGDLVGEPGGALARVAYTLQVGRRAMPERVAFVASSLSQLETQLEEFLAGGPGRDGCFRGSPSPAGLGELLEDDDDARQLFATWIAKRNLAKIAKLWVNGVAIDWSRLHDRPPRRISLPTYPFRRHPIAALAPTQEATRGVAESSRTRSFWEKSWIPEELPATSSRGPRKVVILAETPTTALASKVQALLPGSTLLTVQELDRFRRRDGVAQEPFDGLIDLLPCAARPIDPFLWVPFLQEAIARGRDGGLTVVGVSRGLESYMNDAIELSGALAASLYRTLQYEYSHVISRHIDADPHLDEATLAEQIFAELRADTDVPEVCYRRGRRYKASLQPLAAKERSPSTFRFPANKVLWITGGTRGLGMLCARHFVTTRGVRKLVLTGKDVIPPRDTWDRVPPESALGKKIRSVRELEGHGAEVVIVAADLTDAAGVSALRDEIRRTLGPIGGVIHAAGLVDWENFAFIKKPAEALARVWAPKIQGLANLHRCVGEDAPAFFLTFSSVSATLPTLAVGQLDYAMANAYMDYYAGAHSAFPMTSIQWPSWKDSGAGEARTAAYRETGLANLTDEEGLELLESILSRGLTGVVLPAIVDPARWQAHRPASRKRGPVKRLRDAPPPSAPAAGDTRPSAVASERLVGAVQAWLLELFTRELKMPSGSMAEGVTFDQYGVDSILIAQVLTKMERALGGLRVNPSVVLEYPSAELLGAYLAQAYPAELGALLLANNAHPASVEPPPEPGPVRAAAEAPEPGPVRAAAEAPEPGPVRAAAEAPASTTAARRGADKIAIVGVACHFPEAPSLGRYWSNLRAGRDSIRVVPPSRWDQVKYYDPTGFKPGKTICNRGGFLDDIELFDPSYFGISESLAQQTDPLQRQWLEVSMEALADAGFGRRDLWGKAVGVFAGSKAGNFYQKLQQRNKDSAVGTGQNFIAAHLAHFCNFRGPNLVVDTACASALTAVHLACQSLAVGESEIALAGGVDILLDQDCFVAMSAAQVLAPDGRCKTFSEAADGIGIGEGCGVLVLKPLHEALLDRNKIYAVIEATAVNNDGHTMGITTPNPEMQRALIEAAIRKAQVEPRSITYCETHGTGTLIGDPIELKALTEIFSKATASKQFCGVGSAKTNIGHLLNASGTAGLIKVLLSLIHRELPPSLHCATPNPRFNFQDSPFYVVRTLQRWDGVGGVRRAGISSFGFGGHNAHVIVSDHDVPEDLRADLRPRADMPVFHRRRFWPEPEGVAGPRKVNGLSQGSTSRRAGAGSGPIFEDEDALGFLQSPDASWAGAWR